MIAVSLQGVTSAYDVSKSRGDFTVKSMGCGLNQKKNNNSEITVKANTNLRKYDIGENMILTVSASENAYITVIDHGSDPSKPELNNFLFRNVLVKKGQKFTFPPSSSRFNMQVTEPAGRNILEVIASKTQLVNPNVKSRNIKLVEKVNLSKEERVQVAVPTTNCLLAFEINQPE